MRLHEPDGYECRSAASSGPSPEARRLPDRRGHGPRRSRAAGRRHRNPAHDSSRRCASAEDQQCVWLSSGLAAGLEHAPTGPGRLSTLLASVAVPTTRCVNRQRCACESRHDFRRACRVTSSDRRPARQGKAPTELPLQIEAVPALPQRSRPDLRRRPFGGDFEPVTASTPKQREVLLEQVKAHVTAELASRQRKRGQGRKDGQNGLFECFRWPELVTGCLTGPGRACRGMPASISAVRAGRGAGPVRVHRRGCLGQCRDRCHPQVVSSGNGAVSPVPTTVETHGTRSQRHQTRPGTGEHHDQELSSRCDEGLRCRP